MTDGTHLAPNDTSDQIADAVARACAAGQRLRIVGGNSKRALVTGDPASQRLDVSSHCGVVDYSPRELVVTVRGGTPVTQLNELLASEGQALASEPPLFSGHGTVGGTLACNLSGPARPWAGSLRDAVLGVRIVDGRGQLLRFGGQVMKNVAGYDVSRLQAGAFGTLGVITEISLKVMPQPECSVTLAWELSAGEAVQAMNRRAAESAPLDGGCWMDGRLFLRLSGAADAVAHTARVWGGERVLANEQPWQGLRECTPLGGTPLGGTPLGGTPLGGTPLGGTPLGGTPLGRSAIKNTSLWRLSVGATTPVFSDPCAIDWCGALRWYAGDRCADDLHDHALGNGGYAVHFSESEGTGPAAGSRTPLPASTESLHRRLKYAFDPAGILNPGHLYEGL